MRMRYLFVAVVLLGAKAGLAQAAAPAAKKAAKTSAAVQSEGTKIFEQQCSRCHEAPEGFSPRISGTVVAHMRLRASLSKHDEEVLMKFFNP